MKLSVVPLLRVLLAALLAETFVFGQRAGEAGEFKITDYVNLVVLDVAVHDTKGEFVSNLSKGQFKVWEDGRPCEITHFSSVDVPVTLGLVVDNSGSMLHRRAEVITAGIAFAKESNPKDQFFVVNFNTSVLPDIPNAKPFTDDWQVLRQELFFGKAQGQTALYDAITHALRHLELSHEEKRTLIVVSDGGDNVSRTPLPELLKMIEASRATIYTVGLYDPTITDLKPGVLRKIANVSGGEFFEPKQVSDILPVFHQIANDIRHRYTLGYMPSQTGSGRDIRFIKVAAEANGHKLRVHTRTSYLLSSPGNRTEITSREHDRTKQP